MHLPTLPAAVAALAIAPAAALAAPVYTQDFEAAGPGAGVPGFVVAGGFGRQPGDLVTDAGSTRNGTIAGYLDTGFGANTRIVADTGVAFVPGNAYTLSLDLAKTQTGGPGNPASDYAGTVFYQVYVGNPGVDGDAGAILIAGEAPDTVEGAISASGTAAAGAGNLFIRFTAQEPTNTDGYAQVEFDNLVLDSTPPAAVPEPASLGLLVAGAGALGLRRGRRL